MDGADRVEDRISGLRIDGMAAGLGDAQQRGLTPPPRSGRADAGPMPGRFGGTADWEG